MKNLIGKIKSNRKQIPYNYLYYVFFALLCFLGWAINSLFLSFLSISVFLIVTPLLNSDIRLLLFPALLSFTCFRKTFYFSNIPISVIICIICFSISFIIYMYKNIKEYGLKPKKNILISSLLVFSFISLFSTIIRHIFNNSYAFMNYFYTVPDGISSNSGTTIVFSNYSHSFNILYGYLFTLGLFGLCFVSILISSFKCHEEKYILLKIIYIFSIYLVFQMYYINFIALVNNINGYNELRYLIGWGEKNVVAFAIEISIPICVFLYSKNYKRIDYLIITILLLIALILCKSYGALLAILLVSPLLLYILFKPLKYKIRIISCLYISSLLLFFISYLFISKIHSFVNSLFMMEFNLNGRDIFWTWILYFIKKNPANFIFGGSGSFLFELYPAFSYVFTPTDPIEVAPLICHSTFFTILSISGLLGIIGLLFHRITTIRGVFKEKNDYSLMLLSFITIGIIHGIIDNLFFSVMYFIPYMMLLSEITIKSKEEGDSTMNSNTEEIKVKNGFFYSFFKRMFDIISSGLFLILFSWLILILLFIKFCEDGHNPVYTSRRVGKNGKIIKFHKIRSMKPNADQLKQQLIDQGLNEADGPLFKMKNDPRITRFGKFLRKTSLDEILQIWDVFVGRISVVGPRSPEPKEFEQFSERAKHKVDVKGGLLCLWQIQHNRNQIPFDESIELDIKYIETRSLWLDLKIIFKGAWMVIFDHSGE